MIKHFDVARAWYESLMASLDCLVRIWMSTLGKLCLLICTTCVIIAMMNHWGSSCYHFSRGHWKVTYCCRKLWRCDNESHKARALTHVETSHKAKCCGEEFRTPRGLVPNLPHPRNNQTKQQCSQVCQAKARLVWDILGLGFFVWCLVVFLAPKDDLLFFGNTHCRQSYRRRSRFVDSIVK